jgi:hypothetical protein
MIRFGRYTLVFGIILLLSGLSIAPGIGPTTTTASDHPVQFTTQIYGSSENTKQVVQVTQQQAREIQQLFDDLKNSLSTTESLQETHQLFNDTINELQRYNLLPDELTTHQLKRLVTSAPPCQKIAALLQQTNRKNKGTITEGEIQNYFCSIAGNSSNTHTAKLAKRIAHRLYVIMDHATQNALLVKIATAFWIVFNQISKITQKMVTQNGTHYGVSLYFGNYRYYPYPDWLYPAEGWISTNGINGLQNITGTFWGQTIAGGWQPQDDWYMNYTWRGCLGFSGLIIYTNRDTAYFLGSALQVHVGPNRP